MLFADHALARRLEAAKIEGNVAYRLSQERLRPGSTDCLPVAGGHAVFAGAGSPISRVTGLGMTQAVSAADLDQIESFYRSHQTPILIDLCPLADASLTRELGRKGYGVRGFRNVLYRPLQYGEVMPGPASGLRVTRAAPTEHERWVGTVESGFANSDSVIAPDESLGRSMFHADGVICFLAWAGADAGAGGALAFRSGVGLLSSTSTRPSFRGRGLQTALVWARLRVALAGGCDLAAVETTPGSASQRNIERAGFRIAYTIQTMALD